VCVADALSFTRAAAQLHVTQPTLSHLVKNLEDEVGTRLLERSGRTVRLTAAGRIFREHARRALKEMEAAHAAIGELQGLLRGALAMGVFQSFNSHLMPPVLAKFNGAYPGIRVVVRQLPKREMEERLLDGTLDLGVAYAPADNDNVQAEALFDENLALVVGRKHKLFGRRKINLTQLHEHPLMLLTPEFPLRRVLDKALERMARKPQILLEANSIDAILATVASTGLGTVLAAIKPRSIADLHCIPIEPAITRTAAIFRRRGGHMSRAAAAMAELIRSEYGRRDGAATSSSPDR
jgi:LysR family cyn operon transcriptional activator